MRILAGFAAGLLMSGVFLGSVSAVSESVPTVEQAMEVPAAADQQASPAGTAGNAASPQEASEYVLPYPGMLPDSPLYFFKTMRDRIMEFLISDPTKKAEFYVLQSDKFIGMTTMLIEKGKNDLAADVLAKSNAEMQKAVSGLSDLKANGVTVPSELTGKVTQSIAKHQEVLNNMTGGIPGQAVSQAKDALTKLQHTAAGL